MKLQAICPSCAKPGMDEFFIVPEAPVHSVLLLSTRQEALDFPRREIRLGFCPHCGFIANVAFDPSVQQYSQRYEETQGFSSTFNAFHNRLAGQLIERFDLREKTILEIGCGKGEFLGLLCELGKNRGIGFDPAFIPGRFSSPAAERITFIQDFYSDQYAGYTADFYACKMTLEHIPNVSQFMKDLRRAIGDRPEAVVFFQIPEMRRILCESAFWDIYYEHCSYFTQGSLARLFRTSGFDVLDLWTDYDDQYLMIEARPSTGQVREPLSQEEDPEVTESDIRFFLERTEQLLDTWRRRLLEMDRLGQKVVLWGAGSKGVAFLTALGQELAKGVEYAVDINPHKAGTYMAGTGQEIVLPEFLIQYRPDTVILMNPVYHAEITADLTRLGLSPEILLVNE